MKKALMILFVCSICLIFSACDPVFFEYKYSELSENVVKVELINYDNPRAKKINNFILIRRIQRFDFKKMEILETLDNEELDAFLKSLSNIPLSTMWIHSNSLVGKSIKITYSNDDFDVLSYTNDGSRLFVKYDNRGRVKEFVGIINDYRDIHINILNNYFETQIE
jgi:hypothetical protein